MKHLYQRRNQYVGGELLKILSINESIGHFNNFIYIYANDFENSTIMFRPKIKKVDTHLRKAIPVKVRLAVTLRVLATGNFYGSLQYIFKISKQIILPIVPEVCCALIEALKDYVKVSKIDKANIIIFVYFFYYRYTMYINHKKNQLK